MQTPFMNMTFCVRTFGCQMNKHDSERIAGMLEGLGGLMVDTVEEADIRDLHDMLRARSGRYAPCMVRLPSLKNIPVRSGSPLSKRIVAVGGCIGQRDGDELTKKLPHLDVVFGTHNLSSLPPLLLGGGCRPKAGHQVEVLDASARTSPTELPTSARACMGGMAAHHHRLQQFLHLLHRSLCAGAREVASSGGHRGRGSNGMWPQA